jgi:beta-glucanase (GH16 family)
VLHKIRLKSRTAQLGAALLLAGATLAGCGGGGDSSQTKLLAATSADKTHKNDPALVWSDEFNGSTLDTSKWGYQLGNGATIGLQGWGNNELEYYTSRPENVRVEDGHLIITARKENFTGNATGGNEGQNFTWTSGRIRTAGKFSRTYGKIEFRAKLPVGKGFWPAIWMLPEDQPGNPYGLWAANGEIDVTEAWGSKPDKIAQTLHYGGMWPNNVYSGNEYTFPKKDTIETWHTYTLEWRSNEIKWLVDGVVTSTKTQWWSSKAQPPSSDADLNPWPAPFDKPFYIVLNLAVGGFFDGNPDASTPNQAQMEVDYIRWTSLPDEDRDPGPRPTIQYPWTPKPARPALNGNLIYNPSFDWTAGNSTVVQYPDAQTIAGVTNSYFWNLFKLDGDATASNDNGAVKINITNPGWANWNVQLQHNGIAVTEGRKYEIKFDAWASVNRDISYTVGASGDARGFESYSGGDKTVSLTTAKQTFTQTFSMLTGTNTNARLVFNLANAGVNTVWIDNVSIVDVGPADVPTGPTPGVNLLVNGDFASGLTGWTNWDNGANGLVVSTENGQAKLDIPHVDPSNDWNVQFNQINVPLVAGTSYTLTFTGSASSPRTVAVVVGENGGSYARYLNSTAALTSTSNTYTFTFTAPANNPAAQLQILGAVGTPGESYTLYFDNFSLAAN